MQNLYDKRDAFDITTATTAYVYVLQNIVQIVGLLDAHFWPKYDFVLIEVNLKIGAFVYSLSFVYGKVMTRNTVDCKQIYIR